MPDEPALELPDLAGALDEDESEVLLEEDPADSLAEGLSLSLLPDEESDEDEDEEDDEESEVESLLFFLTPFASARESLR